MAHFYGTVQGARGQASRLGHKNSGLTTVAASYSGAVRTRLWTNDKGDDMVEVALTPWGSAGVDKVLYVGPVNKYMPTKGVLAPIDWKQ